MKTSVGISVSREYARLVLIDEEGNAVNKSSARVIKPGAEAVWEAVLAGLEELLSGRAEAPASCAATSPEDWFIAVDSDGMPLHALDCPEGAPLAEELRLVEAHAGTLATKTGIRFRASSPLLKILRLKKDNPEIFRRTRKFIPMAGFITGKICGEYFTAAPSYGPGLGFDSVSFRWHRFVKELGLLPEALPVVKDHGEEAGRASSPEALGAGIPGDAFVPAPAGAKMCRFFASGAAEPGQWNSHLGPILTLTGPAENVLNDSLSRIHYGCLEKGSWAAEAPLYAGIDSLPEDIRSLPAGPVSESHLIVCLPPAAGGGMLPFVPGEDEGFVIGRPSGEGAMLAGCVEGLAYMEKWALEVLENTGLRTGGDLFATGTARDDFLKIRAEVMEKRVLRPAEPTPEFGAALTGLAKTAYSGILEAARKAVKFDGEFSPGGEGGYRSRYRKFRRACRAIGYE